MKAIIIAVGDELTTGQSVDTNSAFLSLRLAERGVEVLRHLTIPDDQAEIAETFRRAANDASLVLVSGGLGPTPDDLTRQGLADAMGVELHLDEPSLATIEDFFRRRGREMIPANRIQAMIPQGAEAIENPNGTAPGIHARLGGSQIFVTPGVPSEMRAMFHRSILPALPLNQGVVLHRTIRCFGTGESDLADRIRNLLTRTGPVTAGTTVAAGLISVRITSRAGDVAQAQQQAQSVADEIRARLGRLVIGEGEDVTLASSVGAMLTRAGQTLATAESCTGGLVGKMLTDASGSSAYYLGGVVSYSNSAKQTLLDVGGDMLARHGAVSAPVAEAMARGVRDKLGADWGIAITGIAGPTGGTEDKPVGLVYTALAGADGTDVREHRMPGDRALVRLRSAHAALDALRLKLPEGT